MVMPRDARETALFQEAQALYKLFRRPGTGQICDISDVHASPDGKYAVFCGAILDVLEGTPPTRIGFADLTSGDVRVLTFGPHIDRSPKFSPDGRHIAFLSDRCRAGDFQLYLLDPASGAASPTPAVDGWIEYLHWSPDGKRILLGVAGHGADVAGGQGAIASKQSSESLPSWMPTVSTGDESFRWRHVWVYELATAQVRRIKVTETNVWEAAWCGNEAIAAVISSGPDEGLWYSADLRIIHTETGRSRQLYVPKDQLGWPAALPSGRHLAVVEAFCSDRGIVAGDLRVIDIDANEVHRIDTLGVDITCCEWRSDASLLFAGHRGLETVVGVFRIGSGTVTELWCSHELTGSGRYVNVSGFEESGDCVIAAEGFTRAPEIAVIREGRYQTIKSFDGGCAERFKALGAVERVGWNASDGLDIQGWLLRPVGKGPHPLVMNIHGGPVWHWRPTWLGRGVYTLMLVQRGYAVFFPNPRGSSGRGQDFARRVCGDLGGADAQDLLAGVDSLVARGVADPKRLGVTGGSYGGFMTSWLITQDPRFAAAQPLAPHTNQVTEHLLSNIPDMLSLFLADKYNNPAGKYFERSPVMFAEKVRTPTLNVCGALDRCTPPEEAIQFHNALLENGVKSALVTYPQEGHGVRAFPAAIDYAARVVEWFEMYMSASRTNVKT